MVLNFLKTSKCWTFVHSISTFLTMPPVTSVQLPGCVLALCISDTDYYLFAFLFSVPEGLIAAAILRQ